MEEDQRRNCGGVDTAAADSQLSEDEKIERFYALIRNYKEARDRQRIERGRSSSAEEKFESDGNEDDERWRRNRKKIKVGDREQPSWIPAFKWEDFNIRRPLVNFPADNNGKSSSVRGDVKDPPPVPAEIDGGGLNLKLRL